VNIGKIRVIYGIRGSSNSYFIDDRVKAIVDPGSDPGQLRKAGIDFDAISLVINTHCHYDHIANNSLFSHAKVCVHEADARAVEFGDPYLTASKFAGIELPRARVAKRLRDGEVLDFGETRLRVIHTPGHTAGSICLYDEKEKALLTGDLFFDEGMGRTDLPGGDPAKQRDSIEKVSKLEIEHVLPGHGKVAGPAAVKQALELARLILR
jgi:glyoxylase-like metal-dependent hydrolase (beta-lactamase superfamily II)